MVSSKQILYREQLYVHYAHCLEVLGWLCCSFWHIANILLYASMPPGCCCTDSSVSRVARELDDADCGHRI